MSTQLQKHTDNILIASPSHITSTAGYTANADCCLSITTHSKSTSSSRWYEVQQHVDILGPPAASQGIRVGMYMCLLGTLTLL